MTENFSYEILAAVLVIVLLVLLCIEYLWLYIISRSQEEEVRRANEINTRVHGMLEAMLNSPTDSARQAEKQSLLDFMKDDFEKKDETAVQILQLMKRETALTAEKKAAVESVYKALDPIGMYGERLSGGSDFSKGYACRQLADFGATEKIPDMREFLTDKGGNSDLKYHAAMALSQLGDEEGVLLFCRLCENNHRYSHRVLLELLQNYSGDREQVTRRIFDQCNSYIKATAIKAYSQYKLSALSDLFEESMDSSELQLKIAGVKALSQLGDIRFEHRLITALNDKNWIVRLAAVNGLALIGSENALNAIVGAATDEEWWVRKAAAEAIVKLDRNLLYVEKILSGYDKYAADAVKNALYKAIRMNEGDFRR